ncbi:agmatinase, mitochondrial-like [Haliotis rubra]|uniref:agmatinase, mitochondrial-like n=1 Tax=Haliotis rubra TaxID=36100 RepID=UPI001EE50526|nr:agmatinase, mitochondrial-like [Haliotis rubra]
MNQMTMNLLVTQISYHLLSCLVTRFRPMISNLTRIDKLCVTLHKQPRVPRTLRTIFFLFVDLDACFVGIPLDSGASNRSGTRFGPRQIRVESALIRKTSMGTGVDPYSYLRVADVGDISLNMFNLKKACDNIRDGISSIIASGCRPLTMGGDHTLTYPVLQAMKAKYGAVGLIHVDAHSDTSDSMYGEKITHATPFRRAVEEGCLDCSRVIQIGLRGSGYSVSDYDWARNQGFRIVTGEECWSKSMVELMGEVRGMMGDAPVYLSFDIDALDPAYAPGTGTPEIAGLTPSQALQIIRGSQGLQIVGADLVEVSPPYDMAGTTALTAANLLFEMLCILPRPKRS